MKSFPFDRKYMSELLGFIATQARFRPVGKTYLMTSDLAWQFPGCAPKENIRLWGDETGLVAYAWFQPPDGIKFDIIDDSPNFKPLLEEVLSWAADRRKQFPESYPFYIDLKSMDEWREVLTNGRPSSSHKKDQMIVTSCLASDTRRTELLAAHGFETTQHFEPVMICTLKDALWKSASRNFEVRSVTEDELDQRVELHKAAWAPSTGFTLEQYNAVRAISEVYDRDLDIVAIDRNGTLASYTIAWKDPVSKIGSFEPFGTHPQFRGSGASQAVMQEGLRRLHEQGMTQARIYTAGFNHPAQKLYTQCGFQEIDQLRTFLKN